MHLVGTRGEVNISRQSNALERLPALNDGLHSGICYVVML